MYRSGTVPMRDQVRTAGTRNGPSERTYTARAWWQRNLRGELKRLSLRFSEKSIANEAVEFLGVFQVCQYFALTERRFGGISVVNCVRRESCTDVDPIKIDLSLLCTHIMECYQVVRAWRSDTGTYQNRFQALFCSLLRVKTDHLDWLGRISRRKRAALTSCSAFCIHSRTSSSSCIQPLSRLENGAFYRRQGASLVKRRLMFDKHITGR